MDAWRARDVPVALTVLDSPYRDITRPAVEYIADIRRDSPRDVVAVFIPEYLVDHWWEHVLHNQTALRLKTRLLFQPGVMVTSVPWRLGHETARGAGPDVSRPVTAPGPADPKPMDEAPTIAAPPPATSGAGTHP